MHLINTAKKFTEKFLKISECNTEAKFFIKEDRIARVQKELNNNCYKIVIGAGSSGPTTRWGAKNFANLSNSLNETGDYFFFYFMWPK